MDLAKFLKSPFFSDSIKREQHNGLTFWHTLNVCQVDRDAPSSRPALTLDPCVERVEQETDDESGVCVVLIDRRPRDRSLRV